MTVEKSYICGACAAQFPPSEEPPASCPICLDERQFVPGTGQSWLTMDQIKKKYANQYRQHEPGLMGIATVPQLGIGQRALLIKTPEGNILWDCITLLDEATIEIVKGLGGIAGIAISHPHYYTTMADWSHAFGGAPIYLHEDDRQWVTRPDASIQFWSGDTKQVASGLTLIRCGGHFAGGTVAHWGRGGNGKGALLTGDIIMVIPDRSYVSFMRSYPNLIPLSGPSVQRLGDMLEPYDYDVIYGAFIDRNVMKGAKQAVRKSVARYVKAVTGDGSWELQ
jgi:glyoxylase-like metal-dependent hydrolase (beta-lactamase superfamily II)